MSAYREGFELGYQDVTGQRHEAGAMAEAFAQAEAHGEPLLSPEQESDYWLGYYQGRAYARTGQLPEGLRRRAERH